jgi:hypothetical protein
MRERERERERERDVQANQIPPYTFCPVSIPQPAEPSKSRDSELQVRERLKQYRAFLVSFKGKRRRRSPSTLASLQRNKRARTHEKIASSSLRIGLDRRLIEISTLYPARHRYRTRGDAVKAAGSRPVALNGNRRQMRPVSLQTRAD